MTYNAGSVTSTLTADSKGFVDAYDKARAAMMRSKEASDAFKATMLGASQAYERQQDKVRSLGMQLKDGASQASRMGGAMSALGGAMGESGGAAGKAATAFGGFFQMLGSGGTGGVALAGAALAMTALNEVIANQERQVQRLDKAWESETKAATDARNAADAQYKQMKQQAELAAMMTGDAFADRVTQIQFPAARAREEALREIDKDRVAKKQAIVDLAQAEQNAEHGILGEAARHNILTQGLFDIKDAIFTKDKDGLEAAQQHVLATQDNLNLHTQVKNEQGKILDNAREWAKAEQEAALAAERAARALDAQVRTLLRRTDAVIHSDNSDILGTDAERDATLARAGAEAEQRARQSDMFTQNYDTVSFIDLMEELDPTVTEIHDWTDGLKDSTASLGAFGGMLSEAANTAFGGAAGMVGGDPVTMVVQAINSEVVQPLSAVASSLASSLSGLLAQSEGGRGLSGAGGNVAMGLGAASGAMSLAGMLPLVGGPIGMILGAGIAAATLAMSLVELSTHTKGFQEVAAKMSEAADHLVRPLGEAWRAALPLADAFERAALAAEPFIAALVSILPIKPAAELLAQVFSMEARRIVADMSIVAHAEHQAAGALHRFGAALGVVGDVLEVLVGQAAAATDHAVQTAQQSLSGRNSFGRTPEEQDARHAALIAARDQAKATKENTAALQAQRNNLPAGYKGANNAQFRAAPITVNINNFNGAAVHDRTQRLFKSIRDGTIWEVVSARGGDDKG